MEIKRMIIPRYTTTKTIGNKVLCVHCLNEAKVRIQLRDDDDEYYCECEAANEEQRLREEIAWINRFMIDTRKSEMKKLTESNQDKFKEFFLEADLETVHRKHGNYKNPKWWGPRS